MTDTSNNETVTVKTSNRAINGMIEKVRKAGETFNTTTQEALVAIIVHAQTFGDCTAAARLVAAMPTTSRRAEVVKHFADYSPIRVQVDNKASDNKVKVFKANLYPETHAAMKERMERLNNTLWDVDGARANPWYEREALMREPDFDMVFENIYDQALKFAERLENMAKAKVKVMIGGEEREMNKIDTHDQHRVRFLASSLRKAAKEAKAAELAELPDDSTNQTEEPETGSSEPRTGTNG